MTMDEFHQGSCLCGAVKYQVSAPLKAVSHCHCGKCRKAHGAAFATYASAPRSAVSISSSVEALKRFQSSPGITRQSVLTAGLRCFGLMPTARMRIGFRLQLAHLIRRFMRRSSGIRVCRRRRRGSRLKIGGRRSSDGFRSVVINLR